ncbi:MAG TPA: hypothetical protein VGQ36_18400 [Thermoanaerobaculia bacterium]|nr:hypothetical protein [Thermoanaerobaculia bacterium]
MSDLVVDASIAFKWFIPDAAEDDVPAAKALLVDHMEGRIEIAVITADQRLARRTRAGGRIQLLA